MLIDPVASRSRNVSLVLNDYAIVCLEYLQFLAVLQSMGLRWPWPVAWLDAMPGIFLLNADVWEFSKFLKNGTFKEIQDYNVPSSTMPLSYWTLAVAWAVISGVLVLAYCIAYFVLAARSHPFLMVQHAKLQRAAVIVLQILAIPLWSCFAKVFHCVPETSSTSVTTSTTPVTVTNGSFMDVSNAVQCYADGTHLSYVVLTIVLGSTYFIAFPTWLIRKARPEIIFVESKGHEAYLQLKEAEYLQGLDVQYVTANYHIFSSFRLPGAHTRAVLHLLKFVFLILYAALHSNSYYQGVLVTVLLFLMFLLSLILRPYRLPAFNALLAVSYGCLTLSALLGVLRSAFSIYSIQSVWLTPTYMTGMLVAINGLWLAVAAIVLLYIALRSRCRAHCCVAKEPLWPTLMSPRAMEHLPELTQKFMRSILTARQVAERCMSTPAIFAPAHEVSRQIQIINAHCREAEMTSDVLELTLWHLLDELVTVHSQVARVSIFADSVSELSRATAERLAELAPSFVRRLAQREYDFLLVPAKKRRLLLKLYCLRTFLAIPRGKTLGQAVHEIATSSKYGGSVAAAATDYTWTVQPGAQLGPRVGVMDEDELEELRGESVA